jgi:SsrA-binding protein
MDSKTVAANKKARFDYFLEEKFVAGLSLEGWEVKSLRQGKLNIKESYIKDIKDELWLVGAKIDPAAYINQKESVNPLRFRKLLLKKKEVSKILFAISAKGQTCIPVKLFWKGQLAKLEIALAKGKKNYDKKQTKKDADIQRDQEKALKKYK